MATLGDIVGETLASFSLDDYRPIYRRELDLGPALVPRAGNLVKVVKGMRRSGKSYRLFQEMDALRASGVPWDRICYFTFDDERLRPVTPDVGDLVLETFLRLHPDAAATGFYLFLDEVQEMRDWGAWMRRVVDTHRATIYVSGSSSRMLSDEIATEFRGRAVDFELLPFSFRERVVARCPGVALGERAYPTSDRVRLAAELGCYLEEGGFPATFGLPRAQATSLLQSYARDVVARDVVERHNIARPQVASLVAQRALGSNARQFSVRRVEGDLRRLGLPTSRELVRTLLAHLESAYLLFGVREFSYALSEETTSQPKVYAIDPGLAAANSRANANELGQRLEDAIYLELRRRNPGMRRDGISSYRTRTHGYEVDFVVGDALEQEAFEFVQVCANLDDEHTAERERRALWEALDETGLERGTLVVLDGPEATWERDGRTIEQVTAWRWLALGPA